MGQVDANLVCAARLKSAFDQAGEGLFGVSEVLDQAIPCSRFFAAPAQNRHAFSVEWVAPYLPLHNSGADARCAPNDRVVGALDGVIGKLLRQARHCALCLSRYQKPARIFIQPMNDTGSCDSSHSGQRVAAMSDQRIDQSAVGIACRWVHYEPSRLVDDDEIFVFVDDRQRNVLTLRDRRNGPRNCDDVIFAWFDPEISIPYRFLKEADGAACDKLLYAGATEAAHARGQEPVQPPTGLSIGDDGATFRGFDIFGGFRV